MLTIGESIYKDCETPNTTSVPGVSIACRFRFGGNDEAKKTKWCRSCLISEIRLGREQLKRLRETLKQMLEESEAHWG